MKNIFLAFIVSFFVINPVYATELPEFFEGDLHLTKSSSPYVMNQRGLFVGEGNTLFVDPGVSIEFNSNSGLYVSDGGTVRVGTASSSLRIIFDSTSNTYWNGISGSGNLDLSSVIIKHAYSPISFSGSVSISDLILDGNENFAPGSVTGINFSNGNFILSSSTISHFAQGIKTISASGSAKDSIFFKNNVAIAASNSTGFSLSQNSFVQNNKAVQNLDSNGILPINASSNYWGSEKGPGSDSTEGYVLTDPWLPKSPQGFSVCCSNVLFIPGFEGTRLNIGSNQLWEPNWVKDVEHLYFDEEGKSVNPVETGDIIKRTNIGLGLFDKNIYQGISDDLDRMAQEGTINAWKSLPYDWRTDLPLSSDVIGMIHNLAASSITGKVVIVGHSNGGLLAKKILSVLGDASVRDSLLDSVIFVGTPQIGSVSSLAGLLHGDDQNIAGGLIVSNSTMREFGKNLPGAYNLLPSQAFYDDKTPLISFATSTDLSSRLREIYGNLITSYDQMGRFMTGASDLRLPPSKYEVLIPEVLNAPLIDEASYNHWRFESQPYPQDKTDYPIYKIGGVNFPTTAIIEYFSHSLPCIFMAGPVCDSSPKLTHANVKDNDGDGLVSTKSALYGDGTSYLFDIGDYNKDTLQNISHTYLLEAQPVRDLIASIIRQHPVMPQYVSEGSVPEISSVLYRFGIHSPVTLDAYDQDGRHTGKVKSPNPDSDISFVEADIPNSTYEEIGDEAYITLENPEGKFNFKINGLASGTFTFDVKRRRGRAISGGGGGDGGSGSPSGSGNSGASGGIPNSGGIDGEETTEVIFKDVDVQKDSKGEVVFDPSSPSDAVLKVDEDNDGTVDKIITNEEPVDNAAQNQASEATETQAIIQSAFPNSHLGGAGKRKYSGTLLPIIDISDIFLSKLQRLQATYPYE